jgi:PTS system mannose-specific IIA component
MIGLVIISHGRLAAELLLSAEMIIGPLEKTASVNIDRQMSPDTAEKELRAAVTITGADQDGVIILTDLFGGTPTNLSVEFLAGGQVEIVTGVNLPMVLKCASGRLSKGLSELASFLKDYARDAIICPSELLR